MLTVIVILPLLILIPFLLDLRGRLPIAFAIAAVWLLVIAMGVARRRTTQNLLVSLASFSFCLACAEVALGYLNARVIVSPDNAIEIADPDLGYRLQPDQQVTAREILGGKLVFDVTYSIGANGYRVIPAMSATSPCRVVFCCDSVMFGWGLPDGETIPNHFIAASQGRYRGYNLSVNGYGPHQMLRALQTGEVERVIGDGPINLMIYLGIYGHLGRVAGRTNWDLRGPRYTIAKGNDGVTYTGPFHGEASAAILQSLLQNSEIFNFLYRFSLAVDLPRTEEVPLYVAILKQTKREVERRYAPGTFVVLMWQVQGEEEETGIDLYSRLTSAGLDVLKITQILPDLERNLEAYIFPPPDWHPNAAAARRIGQFLAHKLGERHCGR